MLVCTMMMISQTPPHTPNNNAISVAAARLMIDVALMFVHWISQSKSFCLRIALQVCLAGTKMRHLHFIMFMILHYFRASTAQN